jgi:5'-nucleotidase
MHALVTNDDGYGAEGIELLYAVLKKHYDVTMVAPHRENSGVSHTFTFNAPIRYRIESKDGGVSRYIVEGSPADCVKFGVTHLLDRPPDLVVSGINVGENSGVSIWYSGTVAAAREGAFWKIPSFAFSICYKGKPFIGLYAAMVPEIIAMCLSARSDGLYTEKERVYFNVNFPPCHPSLCKGIRITRQSCAFYNDFYIRRTDENGDETFWIDGEKVEVEHSDDYDSRALMSNYISITPLDFDATAWEAYTTLKAMELPRLNIESESEIESTNNSIRSAVE